MTNGVASSWRPRPFFLIRSRLGIPEAHGLPNLKPPKMLLLTASLFLQTAGDVAAVDTDAQIQPVLDAIYAGVSHEPGEEPDWEAFEGIFLPQATLVLPYRPGTDPQVQTVAEFLEFYRGMLAQPGAKDEGFVERCAGFEATIFGNVATVTSVYEARKTSKQEKPDRVGLDLVHLVKTPSGWKAVSLITDFAREDNPLPPALASRGVTEEPFGKVDLSERLEKLHASGHAWDPFLDRRDLHMGVYHLKAGATDGQSPHEEQEIYYVVHGAGAFTVDGKTTSVKAGDVLFVDAQAEHRFHDITEDLDLLVFFARG